MKNNLDVSNTIVVVLTFNLFGIALFTTGFTKDLLLEAWVLLVSIKIIILGNSNKISNMEIIKKLDEIDKKLEELKIILFLQEITFKIFIKFSTIIA